MTIHLKWSLAPLSADTADTAYPPIELLKVSLRFHDNTTSRGPADSPDSDLVSDSDSFIVRRNRRSSSTWLDVQTGQCSDEQSYDKDFWVRVVLAGAPAEITIAPP